MDLSRIVPALSAKSGAVVCLQRGQVVRHAYADLAINVGMAAADLRKWGVSTGSRVGIYAGNCYEWLVYDLAILDLGAISVPFTDDFADTLSPQLLVRYNIALLVVSQERQKIISPRPQHVAVIGGDNSSVQARVAEVPAALENPDILSLVFSSGSAGGIKGIIISRRGVESCAPPIIKAIGITPKDRLLLFLPMSNFQQRILCYAALWNDFSIALTDPDQLFVAMRRLDPTILVAPPVFYQMTHAQFSAFAPAKRKLWSMLGRALNLLPGQAVRLGIARRIFGEILGQFGRSMRILITGMAPIKPDMAGFFEMIQLPLCESYGMVETGSLTWRGPNVRKYGSVGKAVEGVTLSFRSDGEIIVQRPNPLSLGYFQCADGEDERTFIGPGTVATGDMGKADEAGFVYLLGRKKEVIVTANGYKVHPEALENELNGCPDVLGCVFFQRQGANHLSCVVMVAGGEARARVRLYVEGMKSIRKICPFAEVIFADEVFSVENGMLRPNMKIDRKRVAAKYAAPANAYPP